MPTDWVRITEMLVRRSGGFCERCGFGITSYFAHRHHRRLRSQGGKDTLDNLLYLCPSCHQEVHNHPKDATATGFIVASWEDPAEAPVHIARVMRFVHLTPLGAYEIREESAHDDQAAEG